MHDTNTTATVTALPSMMPGGPQHPGGRSLQQLVRDTGLPSAGSVATNGGRQLSTAQTIRHLATQHALTFNRDEDLTLEELLVDAAVIEQYIIDGTRPDPEPDLDSDTE